jgi:Uncharacterized stress-induced protein
MRRGITRGHVTLSARVERTQLEDARIDEARFGAYIEQIRRLQERFGLSGDVDAADVLRLPNVIASRDEETEGTAAELVAIVDRAVAALDQMRAAGGARLARYLDERLSIIEQAVERIDERAPTRLVEQRDRLRAAITELASGVALDDQRLAQEVAILPTSSTSPRRSVGFTLTSSRFARRSHRRHPRVSASDSAFCCRNCCARPTPRAAKPTTRRCFRT